MRDSICPAKHVLWIGVYIWLTSEEIGSKRIHAAWFGELMEDEEEEFVPTHTDGAIRQIREVREELSATARSDEVSFDPIVSRFKTRATQPATWRPIATRVETSNNCSHVHALLL